MDAQNITSKLIDYKAGNLTKAQIELVEEQLSQSEKWRSISDELDVLDNLISEVPVLQPSKESKQRFDQLLTKEKQKTPIINIRQPKEGRSLNIRQLIQIAAAITLLIMGIGIGTQWKNNQLQETEIAALKAEMLEQKKLLALSLLGQSSASDRIKGVNISLQETKMDQQILEALVDRMNLDKNINVQLKAIEGLAQYSKKQTVITALIKALHKQKSPEVQIAIMEILMDLKAKAAYPQFQEILRDKETIDAVKNKAAAGLEVLL